MHEEYKKRIRGFYTMSDDKQADRINRFATETEMIHALLGLAGETGEVVDLLKKHVAYGKPLDLEKLEIELGDLFHYFTRILDHYNLDLESIMNKNVQKLDKRFPKGYTNKDAIQQTEKG